MSSSPYISTLLLHQGLDLINRMLCFNPSKRITVDEALHHPYLQSFLNQGDLVAAGRAHEWSSADLMVLGGDYEKLRKMWKTSKQIKQALYDEILVMKQQQRC